MSTRRWFLPDNPDLLGMLREQTTITVEAMDSLVAWSAGDAGGAERVRACEHRADDAKRKLWLALREAFSPPLDAEDLFKLSADLDEVLNASKDLVREMEVMDMQPDEPVHQMVVLVAGAVGHLADAFDRLDATGDATEARRCGHQEPTRDRARLPAGHVGPAPGGGPPRDHRSSRGLPAAVAHRRSGARGGRAGLVRGREGVVTSDHGDPE